MSEVNNMNYYEDISHISSSMIKAYLKSPAYFEALYVSRNIQRKSTSALDFGQALDTLLTEGKKEFNEQFTYTVLKRDDPERFEANKHFEGTVLSDSAYKLVLQCSETIKTTSAYQWLMQTETVSQPILTGNWFGSPIKGRLDWLTVEGDQAWVTDLKTTTNLHPTKFYYHCLDYDYPLQMAMYRELTRQNYPDVTFITCQHLVVSKNDWPQVATFRFSSHLLDKEISRIQYAIEGIQRKDYIDKDTAWSDAYELQDKTLPPSDGADSEES